MISILSLLLTFIVVILALVGLVLFTFYVGIVIHEFGHYFFRRLFHVPTHVFIGASVAGRYLDVGKWHFGFLPTGGANHDGTYHTLKTSSKTLLTAFGGPLFSLLAAVPVLPFCLSHNPLVQILSIVWVATGVGGVANLIPMATVSGKRASVIKVRKMLDFMKNGDPVSLTDGMWIRVVYVFRKHPELMMEFDSYHEKLRETRPGKHRLYLKNKLSPQG